MHMLSWPWSHHSLPVVTIVILIICFPSCLSTHFVLSVEFFRLSGAGLAACCELLRAGVCWHRQGNANAQTCCGHWGGLLHCHPPCRAALELVPATIVPTALSGGVKQKVSQVPSAQHHCWRGQGIHCCTLTNTNPAWNNCTAPAPCSSWGPRCHGCQWELEPKCSWGFGLFCPGIILLALSHLVASSSTEQFKCSLPPKRKSQLSDDWSILLWINLKIRRFEGFIGLWMSFMLQTCGYKWSIIWRP